MFWGFPEALACLVLSWFFAVVGVCFAFLFLELLSICNYLSSSFWGFLFGKSWCMLCFFRYFLFDFRKFSKVYAAIWIFFFGYIWFETKLYMYGKEDGTAMGIWKLKNLFGLMLVPPDEAGSLRDVIMIWFCLRLHLYVHTWLWIYFDAWLIHGRI